MLGSIALIAGLAMVPASSINAALTTIELDFLESDAANPNIIINATITSTSDSVTIKIKNENGAMVSTVTKIFFHDTNQGFLGAGPATNIDYSNSGIQFTSNNTATFPGGAASGFVVAFGFVAPEPPVTNGLDPGDFVTFSFNGTGTELPENQILDLFNSGNFRIGVLVQGIGGNDGPSASYVTHIPEPSAILLSGLGTMLLLRRRRS